MSNPFEHYIGDIKCQTFDVHDRLSMVKTFTVPQLRAALKVESLQKTVRSAIERRIDQMADHHHRTKGKGRKR